MFSFIAISIISLVAISITCGITYEILRITWSYLPKINIRPRGRVLIIIAPIFALHFVNIWIYAGFYFAVENFTSFGTLEGAIKLSGVNYQSFVEALYFSAATYTSLGFGDVLPTQDLRMLTSAEVLNGLLLIGWTASFTYLTMEKFWSSPYRKR